MVLQAQRQEWRRQSTRAGQGSKAEATFCSRARPTGVSGGWSEMYVQLFLAAGASHGVCEPDPGDSSSFERMLQARQQAAVIGVCTWIVMAFLAG